MKAVLLIGHLDIRIFLREKSGYFWLFVAPLLFIFFFGMMNEPPGEPSNPRPGILVENHDKGELGEVLISGMGKEGIEFIDPVDRDEARRGIRIPEDFSEKIRNKEEVNVEFFKLKESAEAIESMVELRLVRALLGMNIQLFSFVLEGGDLKTVDRETMEGYMSRKDPVSLEIEFGTRKPLPYGYNQTLPGMIIMFLLMNLMIMGASSVSKERLNGIIERMGVYPLSKAQIVTGKIYGRFLLALVQIVYLLVIGELVLNVQISHHPVLIGLVLCLFSWMAASLGVLIGSVLTSPEKTYGVCIGGSMALAAFGGCWWPMEVVSDGLQLFGHLFPTAWAMDALHQLITFGGGFENIRTELLVILGFAVISHIGANFSLRIR